MRTSRVAPRALCVGNLLLRGPEAIFPSGGDRHLWLGSALAITWHSDTLGVWRSLRIFTDANGSDEDGFLPPIVRFATWDRATDTQQRECRWPNVSTELVALPLDSVELQVAITAFQEAVAKVPFEACGLATRRNFGACPADNRGHLSVTLSSGWQELDRAFWVASAPTVHEASKLLETDLRRLARPEPRDRWSERYDRTPDELVETSAWFWDGQPESTSVPGGSG